MPMRPTVGALLGVPDSACQSQRMLGLNLRPSVFNPRDPRRTFRDNPSLSGIRGLLHRRRAPTNNATKPGKNANTHDAKWTPYLGGPGGGLVQMPEIA